MSQQPTESRNASTNEPPRWRGRLVGVLAVVLQVLVVGATLILGLGWGGLTHTLAVVQALLAAFVLLWLVSERDQRAILVPLVSGALTALLLWLGTSAASASACSDEERALIAELTPPPGVVVELRGGGENRCAASLPTQLDPDDLIAHYRAEFAAHGWQLWGGFRTFPSGGMLSAVTRGHVVQIDAQGFVEAGPAFVRIYEFTPDLTPRACSEAETGAITRLAHPAGVTAWQPWGEADNGCVTRLSFALTSEVATAAQVVAHYGSQLEVDGWRIGERGTSDGGGRITASDGATGVVVIVEGAQERGAPVMVTVTAADRPE